MGELRSKHFDVPDEVVTLPKLSGQIVVLGEVYVGRYIAQPGWKWSTDVKPAVGTPSCQFHHRGLVLAGQMHIVTDQGSQRTLGPGEVYDIPPGHDAWVPGAEPCVTIDFLGARDFGRPAVAGERVLATLLFTDIVGSTARAAKLGDRAWQELLSRHYARVRQQIDRFRGYEIKTTGDGFLALFDGTARAVECAAAVCRSAREDDMEVRAGVHSGEVERYTDSVQGVTVHVAQRIMSLAGPGEVLLSAATVALLEGAGLSFSDAGEHELKGLAGKRRLHRLVTEDPKSEGPAT